MSPYFQIAIKPLNRPVFYFRDPLPGPQHYANLAREWVYKLSISCGGSVFFQCSTDCNSAGIPRIIESWIIRTDPFSIGYRDYRETEMYYDPFCDPFEPTIGDPTE